MALRELLLTFGMNVDTKPLEHADKGIEAFKKKAEGLASTFTKVAEFAAGGFFLEKAHEFISSQVESATALERQAAMLGSTTDELQKFQLAGTEAGLSVDQINNSLRFLTRNMGLAGSGSKKAGSAFQAAGISLKDQDGKARPVLDVMGDLADHFQAIEDPGKRGAEAFRLMGRQGQAMLPLLMKGSEGLKEAAKDFDALGGGISEDFIKHAKDAEVQTAKMNFAFTSLKTNLATALLPAFTWITEKVTKLVVWTQNLEKRTGFMKTAVIAFGAAAAIALAPLALELAVPLIMAGALYLLFDDLFHLFTGGKSAIGTLIDKLFGIGTTQKIVQDLHDVWDALVVFWKGDGLAAVIAIGQALGGFLGQALSDVKELFGWVEKLGEGMASISEKLGILKPDKGGVALTSEQFDAVQALRRHAPAGPPEAPLAQADHARIPFREGFAAYGHQTNSVEINVHGSSDPNATGAAVAKHVKKALSDSRGHQQAYEDFGGTDTGS